MEVKMGSRQLAFGSDDFGELRDYTGSLTDAAALRRSMSDDGYLLLRGFHDRRTMMDARRAILEYMRGEGAIKPGTELMDGVIQPGSTAPDMRGLRPIHQYPAVKQVFEGALIRDLFEILFGEPAYTFEYKWLRAMATTDFSGAHYDHIYMGRGSQKLYSCWTPFGDTPLEMGTLAICVGSHKLESFARLRETYGRLDVDRDRIRGDGWYTRDPLEVTSKFGGQWQSTEFRAGDVIIFTMHTLHASTNNVTDRYRISADTRFQPASDPIDERWSGDTPKSHDPTRDTDPNALTMDDAKKQWGV